MRESELAAIEARAQAAAPGPWAWARDYGMSDGRHWCLEQPGNREYTASWALVLMSTQPTGIDEQPFDQHPDLQFVAHARADIPALVAEVRRLRELLQRADGLIAQLEGNHE